jgi:transcriptional regulator with XRE-family HTH domain
MERTAGVRLAAWMAQRLRPVDLARAAGVYPSYVHAVLSGQKPPSQKLLDAARDLGVPVDDLLGGNSDRRAA